MIGVHLKGRLGNQLFQYAFALAAARQLKVSFCLLEDKAEPNLLPTFFEVEAHQPTAWFNFLQSCGRFQTITEQLQHPPIAVANHTLYTGYWQNEAYFQHCEPIIRQHFSLRPSVVQQYRRHTVSGFDMNKSIVLHIRHGDYQHWGSAEMGGSNMSLPVAYYRQALQALEWKGEQIIMVTDDPNWVQENFSFIPQAAIVHEHMMIDFQVLLHAKRLIISNSTFAWWAAWLNPHHPQIIAPQHWLGFKIGKEFPFGILSKKFTPIPVF